MFSYPRAVSTRDREILLLQHLDGRWIEEALTHGLENFCHSTSLVLSAFTCHLPHLSRHEAFGGRAVPLLSILQQTMTEEHKLEADPAAASPRAATTEGSIWRMVLVPPV